MTYHSAGKVSKLCIIISYFLVPQCFLALFQRGDFNMHQRGQPRNYVPSWVCARQNIKLSSRNQNWKKSRRNMPEKKQKADSFGLIFLPPVVILCNTGKGGKYHRSTFIGCRALQWTYSARRPWCQITRLTTTEAAQVLGSCSHGPTPFSDAKNNCLEILKGGIKSE